MSLGIECLLTDDRLKAHALAVKLDQLNRQRREIESRMQTDALELVEQTSAGLDRGAGNNAEMALPGPGYRAPNCHINCCIIAAVLKHPARRYGPVRLHHEPGRQGRSTET